MTTLPSIELFGDRIPSFLVDQLTFQNKKQKALPSFFAGELAIIYKLLEKKLNFKYRKEAIIDFQSSGAPKFTSVQISNHYKLHWFSEFYKSFEEYSDNCSVSHAIYEILRQELGSPAISKEQAGNRFNYDTLAIGYMNLYGEYHVLPLPLDILDFAENLVKLIGFDRLDFGGIDTPKQKQKYNLLFIRKNHRGTGFFFKKKQILEHAFLFESI
jgi:hypothetical protein